MIKRLAMTAALLSAPLCAQNSGVRAGDHVRFTPGPAGTHRVVETRSGAVLALRAGYEPVLVMADSATILRLAGREPRLRSAGRGLVLGAVIGGTLGAIGGAATWEEPDFLATSPRQAALMAGVGFGVLGGATGLVIGALTPRTRWSVASSPARGGGAVLAPTVRGGRVGASLTVRF